MDLPFYVQIGDKFRFALGIADALGCALITSHRKQAAGVPIAILRSVFRALKGIGDRYAIILCGSRCTVVVGSIGGRTSDIE